VVQEVLTAGSQFGQLAPEAAPVSSAMIEFVSANPTGPLHGRWPAMTGSCD
jgi:arginyl-tRNA synthetase